jgi:hypothetical protein
MKVLKDSGFRDGIQSISGHQQRWFRPLPGAIRIPPALLLVADLFVSEPA